MSLSILIDMNLSPGWVAYLTSGGWNAVHWSSVGAITAPDETLMKWAIDNQHIVFTHDLDFGTLLAMSQASQPSVIQLRSRQILPEHASAIVLAALSQYEAELQSGALLVIEEASSRVRILPL